MPDWTSVLFGDGNGQFASPNIFFGQTSYSTAVADINGDDHLDLVLSSGVIRGLGNGTFGFNRGYRVPTYQIVQAIPTDIDGDQVTEVVLLHRSGVAIIEYENDDSWGWTNYPYGSDEYFFRVPDGFVADINRDGLPDVVTINSYSLSLTVFQGQGGGQLAAPAYYKVGGSEDLLAVGDFNSDGYLDAVIPTNGDALTTVFGTPDARFHGVRTQKTPLRSGEAIVLADLSRDGHLDAVTLNSRDASVSVFTGDGNGAFSEVPEVYDVGVFPIDLLVADFNSDEILDLATLNYQSQTVSILLGKSEGGFDDQVVYSTLGESFCELGVFDFNDDQILDLYDCQPDILLGNGDGTFRREPGRKAHGEIPFDLNNDDLQGYVKPSDGITVTLIDKNGSQSQAFFGTSSIVLSVLFEDLNSDDNLDIVAIALNYEILVLTGDGNGNFRVAQQFFLTEQDAPWTRHRPIALVDINDDSLLDLVDRDGYVAVGNGDGTFAPAARFALPGEALAVGDVNEDGLPDIVQVTDGDYELSVVENQANSVNAHLTGPDTLEPGDFVPTGERLNFEIEFRKRTSRAKQIMIETQLDDNLDPATFQFGKLTIGNIEFDLPTDQTSYSSQFDATDSLGVIVEVEATLNPNTRTATWTIRATDPDSGNIVTDRGLFANEFLYPNRSGTVSYSILPQPSNVDAVSIVTSATVEIDDRQTETPQVIRRSDQRAPTSEVVVPSQANLTFPVQWLAQDGAGSGVVSTDIFVSIDGAAPQLWLTSNTSEGEADYDASVGQRLTFYSIAHDLTGNSERHTSAKEQITDIIFQTNLDHNFDVNADGIVSPLDAILVINILNSSEPVLKTRGLPYPDVSFDGHISPLDVLMIINRLNQRAAEGEPTWLFGFEEKDEELGVEAVDAVIAVESVEAFSGDYPW